MNAARFDPIRKREFLLGDCGYEWSLSMSYDYAKAENGLAAVANSNLSTAIECILVGFDEPAERLLKRSVEWVKTAIAMGERPHRYFANGTEALNRYTLAMCNWLLFDSHDLDSYQQFVEYEDRYLTGTKAGKSRVEVSFVLPGYIDAGAFQRALEIFERTPGLSPPKSLALRSEAHMSYVLCRHHLGLQYSRDEVDSTTDKFLRRNLNAWLSDGGWERAAAWMKIVHWNMRSPRPSARETLLKCYEYLPGCQRPL